MEDERHLLRKLCFALLRGGKKSLMQGMDQNQCLKRLLCFSSGEMGEAVSQFFFPGSIFFGGLHNFSESFDRKKGEGNGGHLGSLKGLYIALCRYGKRLYSCWEGQNKELFLQLLVNPTI